MRFIVWLVRAALFFTLLAFALNNGHDTTIRWFFGHEWRAPTVIVVLAAFVLGCAVGIFAMVPSWWKHRRVARRQAEVLPSAPGVFAPAPVAESVLEHPPRDGL